MAVRLPGWFRALPAAAAACACTWACSGSSKSSPPPVPSGLSVLGAHVLLTHDQNRGTSPATTTPVATQPAGSLLLAIGMGRTVNFATPTDSYGNSWELIGERHPYADGPFYTAVWAAARARGGSGHTLSATKRDDPADELSLALVEIRNAALVRDTAYAYPRRGSPHTPGSVTTQGPATLIAVWGGDASELAHTAVPGDGFRVIDSYLALGPTSGIQIAIAAKQVSAAGTYSVTWTATPPQGAACYLIAVE